MDTYSMREYLAEQREMIPIFDYVNNQQEGKLRKLLIKCRKEFKIPQKEMKTFRYVDRASIIECFAYLRDLMNANNKIYDIGGVEYITVKEYFFIVIHRLLFTKDFNLSSEEEIKSYLKKVNYDPNQRVLSRIGKFNDLPHHFFVNISKDLIYEFTHSLDIMPDGLNIKYVSSNGKIKIFVRHDFINATLLDRLSFVIKHFDIGLPKAHIEESKQHKEVAKTSSGNKGSFKKSKRAKKAVKIDVPKFKLQKFIFQKWDEITGGDSADILSFNNPNPDVEEMPIDEFKTKGDGVVYHKKIFILRNVDDKIKISDIVDNQPCYASKQIFRIPPKIWKAFGPFLAFARSNFNSKSKKHTTYSNISIERDSPEDIYNIVGVDRVARVFATAADIEKYNDILIKKSEKPKPLFYFINSQWNRRLQGFLCNAESSSTLSDNHL